MYRSDLGPDDPRRRIAPLAAIGTVAAVVAGAALVFWLGGGNLLPQPRIVDPASDPAPPRRPAAAEPPQGTRAATRRALARLDAGPADLLAPPTDEPGAFHAPVALAPPYDVIDSMTFRASGRKVRLAHIEGVRRGDVCYGEDGLKFACGLMGRVSLANFLGSGRVVCYPSFEEAGADAAEDVLPASCYLGAADLAEVQIRAGVARPLGEAAGRYREAFDRAREAGAGAWNGGWSLMDLPDDKRDGR